MPGGFVRGGGSPHRGRSPEKGGCHGGGGGKGKGARSPSPGGKCRGGKGKGSRSPSPGGKCHGGKGKGSRSPSPGGKCHGGKGKGSRSPSPRGKCHGGKGKGSRSPSPGGKCHGGGFGGGGGLKIGGLGFLGGVTRGDGVGGLRVGRGEWHGFKGFSFTNFGVPNRFLHWFTTGQLSWLTPDRWALLKGGRWEQNEYVWITASGQKISPHSPEWVTYFGSFQPQNLIALFGVPEGYGGSPSWDWDAHFDFLTPDFLAQWSQLKVPEPHPDIMNFEVPASFNFFQFGVPQDFLPWFTSGQLSWLTPQRWTLLQGGRWDTAEGRGVWVTSSGQQIQPGSPDWDTYFGDFEPEDLTLLFGGVGDSEGKTSFEWDAHFKFLTPGFLQQWVQIVGENDDDGKCKGKGKRRGSGGKCHGGRGFGFGRGRGRGRGRGWRNNFKFDWCKFGVPNHFIHWFLSGRLSWLTPERWNLLKGGRWDACESVWITASGQKIAPGSSDWVIYFGYFKPQYLSLLFGGGGGGSPHRGRSPDKGGCHGGGKRKGSRSPSPGGKCHGGKGKGSRSPSPGGKCHGGGHGKPMSWSWDEYFGWLNADFFGVWSQEEVPEPDWVTVSVVVPTTFDWTQFGIPEDDVHWFSSGELGWLTPARWELLKGGRWDLSEGDGFWITASGTKILPDSDDWDTYFGNFQPEDLTILFGDGDGSWDTRFSFLTIQFLEQWVTIVGDDGDPGGDDDGGSKTTVTALNIPPAPPNNSTLVVEHVIKENNITIVHKVIDPEPIPDPPPPPPAPVIAPVAEIKFPEPSPIPNLRLEIPSSFNFTQFGIPQDFVRWFTSGQLVAHP